MKTSVLFVAQIALLAACAPWPEQTAMLNSRAAALPAPALLPQDQLLAAPVLGAETAGAALAARAAALRAQAAGL